MRKLYEKIKAYIWYLRHFVVPRFPPIALMRRFLAARRKKYCPICKCLKPEINPDSSRRTCGDPKCFKAYQDVLETVKNAIDEIKEVFDLKTD